MNLRAIGAVAMIRVPRIALIALPRVVVGAKHGHAAEWTRPRAIGADHRGRCAERQTFKVPLLIDRGRRLDLQAQQEIDFGRV